MFIPVTYLILSIQSCSTTSKLEQYGSMHEAIGKQQHHSRVGLKKFRASKNYLGLGAIEKLQGEITILDGNVITTVVSKSGEAIPLNKQEEIQATILIAEKTQNWRKVRVEKDLNNSEFETWLSEQVYLAKLNRKSVMFKVKGEFINLHTHVINGACPVHAKRSGKSLPNNKKPFKKTFNRKNGVLVGVYAPNSTGGLTHPGTNIHGHFVSKNDHNEYITGHIETSGVAKNSIVYLPYL